ncbi:MAG: hypothetical protein QNJ64_16395 [Crocosphaera sp.]|nr:hypothetical protein [Crocosphaera sp.]
MLSTTKPTTIIRNYVILATTVMVMSVGLVDTFNHPTRGGQKDRLDNYGRVVSAGVVAQAQKFGR